MRAVEDADRVPATADEQDADPARAHDVLDEVTGQRRERNVDPGPRAVGSDKLDNVRAVGRRHVAVPLGEAGEPPLEAFCRHHDRPGHHAKARRLARALDGGRGH